MTFTRQQASKDEDHENKVTTRMSDFLLMDKIGDGAYSEVFKVKRLSDNKIYALKKVSCHKSII